MRALDNPVQETNRDLSIAMIKLFQELRAEDHAAVGMMNRRERETWYVCTTKTISGKGNRQGQGASRIAERVDLGGALCVGYVVRVSW